MRVFRIATLLVIGIFALQPIQAQNVAINGTGAIANPSAILDVDATNKGLLIPRVALTSTADVATVPTPATSLLVYNTSTVSNVTPGFYYWGGAAWIRLSLSGDDWRITGNAGTTAATHFVGTTDNIGLTFRTNNTERMRIQPNGLVGIGTNTPTDLLQIAGGNLRIGEVNPANTGVMPDFGRLIHFSGGPAPAPYTSDNSDPLWMGRYNQAQDQTELRVNLSDNCGVEDAFVIQSGGSGCTANTVYFRFDASGVAYRPGGGAWTTFSDRRLKTHIRPYETGLGLIMALDPISYQYNGVNHTPLDGQRYVGLIAQDLQALAPDMVKPQGEYLTVDPSAFTYTLINAVQEQQAQIEALKAENAALKAKQDAMAQDIQSIKQVLNSQTQR